MQVTVGRYLISDDPERLDLAVIQGFLARSYWADKRPLDKIERSIKNSVCIGVYEEQKQVGFARLVTDDATMYWLCDVFIDEDYRGQGLGKALVSAITESERFGHLMGLLGTRDAHELYEQYAFRRDGNRFMTRLPNTSRAES